MKLLISFVALCFLSWNTLNIVLGTSPCSDPCGGSHAVAGTHGQGPRSSLNFTTAVANLLTSTNEARAQADQLVRNYNNNSSAKIRISNHTANTLNVKHHVPFNRRSTDNITEALQNDFNDVTTIAAFVATIHKKERDSGRKVNYSHLMDDLEGSLDATLCKIKIAAQTRGDNLVCTETHNRQLTLYKTLPSDSMRYTWDYVVFTDAVRFFTAFATGYNSGTDGNL